MRTEILRPSIVTLRGVDNGKAISGWLRSPDRYLLPGRKTRVERFANKSKQRAYAQGQEGDHLFENIEPGHHVERIYCSRPDALIKDKWRYADYDMRPMKHLGLLVNRREHSQRFTCIIGEVYSGSDRSAAQLCCQLRINLILGSAFTGKNQVGSRLQQWKFDSQNKGNIDMNLFGEV